MFEGYFTTRKIIIVFRNFVSENSVYWYTFFFSFSSWKVRDHSYLCSVICIVIYFSGCFEVFPLSLFSSGMISLFILLNVHQLLGLSSLWKKNSCYFITHCFDPLFFPLILKWHVCLTTWCCSTNRWGFLHFACFISFCLCASV